MMLKKLPDHVGIDFGNYSVKGVDIKDISKSPTLVGVSTQPIPSGLENENNEVNEKEAVKALKLLYKNTGISNKNVVIAMPESTVFTRFITFPGLKENEIETAVYYQAKQYLPIPVSDVNLNYIILGYDERNNSHNVLVLAAPKKLVETYTNVVYKAGLEPLAIETESVAIGRSMFKSTGLKDAVMVNLGSQTTDVSVMSEGRILFSQSMVIGANALTQALMNEFRLEYDQAEQYKRTYGVKRGELEDKMYNVLKPILDETVKEIQRAVEFYKTSAVRSAPKDYLLNGDAALLPGLPEFLKAEYNLNAYVADPWNNIQVSEKYQQVINKNRPSYAVAVGLALKDF